jgi:PAS domain S-box-containing protein
MNQTPTSILRWVRRAFIAYSLHFVLAFIAVTVLHRGDISTNYAYTPFLVGLVLIQMTVEVIVTRSYFEPQPWMAVGISFGFALIETFVAAGNSGMQTSPYFIAGVGMVIASAGSFFYWQWRNRKNSSSSKLGSTLHLEQLKSDLIIDSIDDGVVIMDEQKIVRLFNPAASTITGWKASDVIGLDYKSVFKLTDQKGEPYTDEKDPFGQVFAKATAVHDNNAVLINTSDKPVAVTFSVSPLLDKDKVTGLVGIFRDVSQERGEEKRSADFVSTASHEMRTPVAAIEGYLALALNERVSTIDSKAREYLEKAHESTQHLGKLFQDLLTSTKAEDGRLSDHPSVIEMSAFTEKVVEDLRFSAEKKGLHMEYVMGTHTNETVNASHIESNGPKVIKPLYYVHADPERIREVVTNLFDNAVKYTESGTISIGLTGNNDVIQISIKDTGPGIPESDIPHLFQKFYRVDSSATRTIGGTGLGLFICAKIIELYNGRIWVESKVGEGSTFYINLPRLDATKAKELAASEANATTVTPLPTGSAS